MDLTRLNPKTQALLGGINFNNKPANLNPVSASKQDLTFTCGSVEHLNSKASENRRRSSAEERSEGHREVRPASTTPVTEGHDGEMRSMLKPRPASTIPLSSDVEPKVKK